MAHGIRVNAVAPGPVWTPLDPSDLPAPKVADFGRKTDMGRAAQPEELAPADVFLAAPTCSSDITGVVQPVTGSVGPATAATVLGAAVPLAQRLLRPAPAVDDSAPPTVPRVDLLRFAGTWHEQARLPAPFEGACDSQPRATYTPGAGGLLVHNECHAANGALRSTDGVARVVPGSGGARLQVTFMPPWLRWLPFVWADLWLLHVDERAGDDRVAIAGHPARRGLWLLSRRARLPAAELQQLIAQATDLGYDTSRLVFAGNPPTLH